MNVKALALCMDCTVNCENKSCETCHELAIDILGEKACPLRFKEWREMMNKVNERLQEIASEEPDSEIGIDYLSDIFMNS